MKEAPLFPFGYGLSYTTFRFGKAKASKKTLRENETLTLNIPVKNTGDVDGEEVIQVYLKRDGDSEGPQKALRAFKRVNVESGKTVNVEIEMPYSSFEWFDVNSNTMHPLTGEYTICYGSSSMDKDLHELNVTLK
jgi:beta-glucosidase